MAALGAGGFTLAERQRLAAEAFVHTATYDNAVASWMGTVVADTTDGTGFPAWTGATWDRVAALRYGENPHQPAALYRHWRPGIAHAEQLHGKEMSYNNYVDADAAVRAAHDHGDQPTVAIIKHANPCGIAVGETLVEAYDKAHACDPQSAYGGIIATNQTVTADLVEHTKGVFTEVIVAPDFDDDALELLRAPQEHPGAAAAGGHGAVPRPDRGPSGQRRDPRPDPGPGRRGGPRRGRRADRRRRRTPTGGSSPGSPRTRRRWPTSPSRGGRSAR